MPVSNVFATAVSGLQAFNVQLTNISQNVANSSTLGYKAVETNFQSFVASSNSSNNSGGGVIAKAGFENNLQGQLTGVSNQTSVAINGPGFLAVQQPFFQGTTPSFANVPTNYTRQGDFSFDSNGYLVNSAGQYLMGIPPSNGSFNVSSTASMTAVQKTQSNVTVPGTATANVSYNINFPANAITTANTTGTQTTQVQIYDSLGSAHSVPLTFTPSTSVANQWTLSVPTPLPTGIQSITVGGDSTFSFNPDGTLIGPGVAGGNSIIPTLDITYSTPVAGQTTAQPNNQTVNVNLGQGSTGTFGAAGYVAGTGSTQFAGTTLTTNSVTVDGQSAGVFQSASVTNQGFVVFNYSNGTQVPQYQIPIFTFANPNGLTRISGSLFAQNSQTSGLATPEVSAQGGAGQIEGATIENSNVDISQQFTDMITAQRSYEANAKVVTTADTVTQDTINLIR